MDNNNKAKAHKLCAICVWNWLRVALGLMTAEAYQEHLKCKTTDLG